MLFQERAVVNQCQRRFLCLMWKINRQLTRFAEFQTFINYYEIKQLALWPQSFLLILISTEVWQMCSHNLCICIWFKFFFTIWMFWCLVSPRHWLKAAMCPMIAASLQGVYSYKASLPMNHLINLKVEHWVQVFPSSDCVYKYNTEIEKDQKKPTSFMHGL